jgi:hypothetical protein
MLGAMGYLNHAAAVSAAAALLAEYPMYVQNSTLLYRLFGNRGF